MTIPLVDLVNLELTDAMQISPRATWASIGSALGLSEATVSRRWNSLVSRGLAWTSSALHPSVTLGAFIEIRVGVRLQEALMQSLAQHPDVITVGQTTGDDDVFCIVASTTLEGVLRCVHGGLPELAEAEHVRTSLFRHIAGGVHWSQGVLSAADERRLQQTSGAATHSSPPELTVADRDLFLALGEDGRASATELSRRLGRPVAHIRRRIDQLVSARQLIFRADVARPVFDLPIGMVVRMKAPPAEADAVARQLGQWRQTRFCAAVVGGANVILVVGLHDLADAERILARLTSEHPDIEVTDQRITTRLVKVYGRLLDEHGRAVGLVPVDPWVRTLTSERSS